MRILMVSKALVVGMYQRKLEELAAEPDIELTVAVPPFWRERGHDLRLERSFTEGYKLHTLPIRFNGHFHVHFYQGLGSLLDRVRPDLLHFDEEAYNLSTWLALQQARRRGIKVAFYSWQNIQQRYPIPFRWIEAEVLSRADLGFAGNQDAARILRLKGFKGPLHVVPQFGIDPELFTPEGFSTQPPRPFTVGFVGRLVPVKGLDVLLNAVAGLDGDWRLEVVGTGPERQNLETQVQSLGLGSRVVFHGRVASTRMPEVLRGFDVLAGPSLTSKRWKEQFGRMLVEAMACQVAVVGSDSGEIAQVIGDAGLVAPEGDVAALRSALLRLRDDPQLRRSLAEAGRRRVLAEYTQAAVASRTADAYRLVLGTSKLSSPCTL